MTKKQASYSIDEAKTRLDKYLDVSAERLRTRLRTAWKKQSTLAKVYEKTGN